MIPIDYCMCDRLLNLVWLYNCIAIVKACCKYRNELKIEVEVIVNYKYYRYEPPDAYLQFVKAAPYVLSDCGALLCSQTGCCGSR